MVAYAYHNAMELETEKTWKDVVFVSKDLNCRIKGSSLGIEVQDFESDKVNMSSLYTGWGEILVNPQLIVDFYAGKTVTFEMLKEDDISLLSDNCFVMLKDETNFSKTALGRVNTRMKEIKPLTYQGDEIWGITALNVEQRYAFDLLLDPSISLVTLLGGAGTGKTLLALAAGLLQTMDLNTYKKILIARPIVTLGKDIGFLPGHVDEKLGVWMQPIFDNLAFIMSRTVEGGTYKETAEKMKYFTDSGLIEMQAVTYIRGRSIPDQYIIIDEAQNLTPHEVKTIISRVGRNSKIILTGDPYQIDNPYLDAESNGLAYVVERFKGQELFGHVALMKSERSPLASLAADLL